MALETNVARGVEDVANHGLGLTSADLSGIAWNGVRRGYEADRRRSQTDVLLLEIEDLVEVHGALGHLHVLLGGRDEVELEGVEDGSGGGGGGGGVGLEDVLGDLKRMRMRTRMRTLRSVPLLSFPFPFFLELPLLSGAPPVLK